MSTKHEATLQLSCICDGYAIRTICLCEWDDTLYFDHENIIFRIYFIFVSIISMIRPINVYIHEVDKSMNIRLHEYREFCLRLPPVKNCTKEASSSSSSYRASDDIYIYITIRYAAAGFYLYPTSFDETSCVSIMKAMVNGAIPITSKRGALSQVVGAFDMGPLSLMMGKKHNDSTVSFGTPIYIYIYAYTYYIQKSFIPWCNIYMSRI